MPGTTKTKVKLIFSKDNVVFIGGGVSGGESMGELINIISVCIINKMTIDDLITFQMGTHPALTTPPIVYQMLMLLNLLLKQ